MVKRRRETQVAHRYWGGKVVGERRSVRGILEQGRVGRGKLVQGGNTDGTWEGNGVGEWCSRGENKRDLVRYRCKGVGKGEERGN